MAGNRQFPKNKKRPRKMSRAPKKEKNPAPKKSGRGGARPGAGAPKGRARPTGAGKPALKNGEKSQQICVRLANSDAQKLKKIAHSIGMNSSEYIRDLILKKIS